MDVLYQVCLGRQAHRFQRGGELFYRNGTRVLSASVGSEAGLAASRPVLVFEGNYAFATNLTIPNYDVTNDGQRFVMIKEESTAGGSVQVVVNWFEELKRLVPTNNFEQTSSGQSFNFGRCARTRPGHQSPSAAARPRARLRSRQ